jgi:glycosyltransferase involved in cell wall biosynthesis
MSNVMIVSTDYGPPWNEGEKNIAHVLENALAQNGWETSVCANPGDYLEAPPRHRASLREITRAVRFWTHAARTGRQRGARVIHLLSSISSLLGLKCAVIKRMSGASLLLHVTGLAKPVRGYRLLLRADRIVVGGSYLRPFFPDAVDLPPISPHMNPQLDDDARLSPVCEAPRRILYLGAMEPERGVHTLIDALGMLGTELASPRFTLTIAWNGHGSKDYARRIREQIGKHRLEARVRWEGVVSDLASLYREHDVVVIPRAARERMGFPLRLIEALSYGKPVVVSDIGELPIVAEGCGLVFPRGDARALAGALRELMSDPQLYSRCMGGAYETARRYETSRTVGRFMNIYRELAHVD